MKKNTELVEVGKPRPKADASVEAFIVQAIAQNVPVETMERLLALRDRVKAEKAKEAFVEAMAAFQAACPVVEKTKAVMNKDGGVRYKYAPLESIVSQVKSLLGREGLSYTVDVVNEDRFITAVCRVTHRMGHSETSSFKVPIDTGGFMSAPQQYAAALTFAKRYAFCNALGILTGDEDTDAAKPEERRAAKPVSVKAQIMHLLRVLGKGTDGLEAISDAVFDLTGLNIGPECTNEELEEIKGRLEVVAAERHQNEDPQV